MNAIKFRSETGRKYHVYTDFCLIEIEADSHEFINGKMVLFCDSWLIAEFFMEKLVGWYVTDGEEKEE